MTVWQVAAGAAGRDYSDRFLKHGMAFVGGENQRVTMRESVQLGDTIILKRGLSEIIAVGRVVERGGITKGDGDKEWLRDFDGWDLQAWCYVDWHKSSKPIQADGLNRGTILGVNNRHLLGLADRVLSSNTAITSYEAEPRNTKEVKDDVLISDLIELGLRPGAAEELTQATAYSFACAFLFGSKLGPDQ